jgi:hypothetical protein
LSGDLSLPISDFGLHVGDTLRRGRIGHKRLKGKRRAIISTL